jgi:tetratricopeptide (TPR) repeat protein
MIGGASEAAEDHRFELRGSLGAGGMGVVYRAFDRRLGREVALKVVRHASGGDLYRFKREFRAVAGIIHPNLVTLHELHTAGDEWFFTMDLIDGVSFVDWIRGTASPATPSATTGHEGDATVTATIPLLVPASGNTDYGRLRAALLELVDGVLAVHAAGKLHRDLKPSNVLVGARGRVVVLDFGLAASVDTPHLDRTHEHAAVGTPAYMSPEQAGDRTLTEASDWYAVGAMLFEALTGRRPFEGSTEAVLRRKQQEVPVRPSELDPSVPPDLDDLCARLLALRPADRPGGRDILAVLGGQPSQATLDVERTAASGTFVGRRHELADLRAAAADARARTVTVFIGGESGIGKTQLVQHFVGGLGGDAIVLEGRCFERESVPFRTLDAVIDALTGQLLALPTDDLRAMLPRETAALARLFPVLRRVPVVAERVMVAALPASPQELRRRAFDGLRALLARLAELGPLVITIDDLQWGDADSAVFLAELAHHPDPLPLLLLLVHRPEDDAGIVAAVRAAPPGVAPGDVRTLTLGSLSDADARLLISSFTDHDASGEDLLREAGGHPLFLAELARATGRRHRVTSLDELIKLRLAALPAPAAALLRVVAVAARPLPLALAERAAGIDTSASEQTVLRAERLACVRVGASAATALEPYHDRVRRAVLAAMTDDERRAVHRALALAYEATGSGADREALVADWVAAGEPGRAAGHAVAAARHAESVLAFHRAADLYALALVHGEGHGDGALGALRRQRAEALTSAGRLDEAVTAFAEAAEHASGDEARALDARRLEQLLRRGRLAEGLELARRVLADLGISLPVTRAGAIRAVVWQMARLWLRGLDFTERTDAPEATLRVVDLLYSTSTGLGLVDPITGRVVQCHYVRAALDAGEPGRACSALAVELGYLGPSGTRAERRIDALSTRVRDLAERIGDPYVQGRATTLRGFVRFMLGRWRDATLLAEAGLRQMHDHGVGVRWDFDFVEDMQLAALTYLGETREVARLAPIRMRDAVERGDVYALGDLRGGRGNVAWLIAGKPDEARAHVDAVAVPSADAKDLQLRHFDQLSSHAQIDLYVGDGAGAWARLEAAWRALEASLMLRIQILRIEGAFLRGRAALAAAITADGADRKRLIAAARNRARALLGEKAGWAEAFALQIRATAAHLDGAADTAAQLDRAERAYAAADMRLHATVMRLRKGELEGGTAGATIATGARDAMRAQAIADPDAMARLLCPWPPR